MKICLLVTGKTDAAYLREGIAEYEKRLKFYASFETRALPATRSAKNLTESLQKEREGAAILAQLEATDTVVLLDERGVEYTSREFSGFLERQAAGGRRLVFVIGGPYGFSGQVYERADARVALSRMTFSHQMARLFFAEQLYRAMTIWKGEPYHHG
jgi:23S rRNA (pseudouridine1915-N3)-methyltransferase